MANSRKTASLMVGFGAAMALVATTGYGWTHEAVAAAQPSCGSSFDPYSSDPSTLSACGIISYPLQSVATLADGSHVYTYTVEGDTTTYTVPPAGFDMASASPAQLAEYGVPPAPPTGTSAYSVWEASIQKMHILTPPSALVSVPVRADGDSNIWAGWEGMSNSSTTYNTVETYFKPEQLGSSRCSTNSVVFWSGLGGDGVSSLAQDGTGQNTPGLGQDQTWTEVLPTQTSIVPQNLYGTYNQFIEFYAHHGGAHNDQFSFFMQNQYTGDSVNPVVTDSHYNGTTAEVIAERPTVNGVPTNLSNFGTVNFDQSSLNGHFMNDGTYRIGPFYMYNNSTELAVPSGIDVNHHFVVTQLSCN